MARAKLYSYLAGMPVPLCAVHPESTNAIAQALSKDWISNAFNLAAILISLGVFFWQLKGERKRAKDERVSRIKQRHVLVETAQECIDEAIDFMNATHANLIALNSNLPLNGEDSHLQHVIEPVLDSVSALQRAIPADGGLALTIARIRRTLVDLHTSRGAGANPNTGSYKIFVEQRISDLNERRAQLDLLREPGSRLP